MKRRIVWGLAGIGLVAVAGVVVLAAFLPGERELAARLTQQAQARLGVEVTVGAVQWKLFPPSLLIEDAATVQPEPISFRRLEATPRLAALLAGHLQLKDVFVDGGVMPQLSLRGLKVQPAPPGPESERALVEQLRFRNLTWITRHGKALEFDGSARFDAGWRPRDVQVERPGTKVPARMTLTREGADDRWQALIDVGGGSVNGVLALQEGPHGAMTLTGELQPRDVEVDSALESFKRNSAVSGKASGRTTVSASGKTLAELARSLHTRTTFSLSPATVLRIDIDKAIRTAGRERAGQTQLQSLTGQMDTQNSPSGMVVRYSALQAKGETFSASGGGTIADRQIDGEVRVDLVGGLVGIPLTVSGPLDAPQVKVPASAVAGAAAGAAIGTAVLPGIGTAIGASVGAAIGKVLGNDAGKAKP